MIDISKYIGKPYQHRGEGQSFDCLSLVITALNEHGYNLPPGDGEMIRKEWYREDPERLIKGLKQYGKRISVDELQPLDVVVFSFRGIPRHAGVMVDRSHMIHARQGKDVAIIRLKHYMRFFHSAWRMEVNR